MFQQLPADPKKAGKFQSFDLSPITTRANGKEVLQCLWVITAKITETDTPIYPALCDESLLLHKNI